MALEPDIYKLRDGDGSRIDYIAGRWFLYWRHPDGGPAYQQIEVTPQLAEAIVYIADDCRREGSESGAY